MEDEESLEIAKIDMSKNHEYIRDLVRTCGTITLTKEERAALFAPVNPETVEIRADGMIYLPWMEYVSRLRDVFGMEWAAVPNGMPTVRENKIIWGFVLVIRGNLSNFAIGEQEYFPGNARMSWSDACEGAKSNALMRLCKGAGIGLEMWQPSFIRCWKDEYAEAYPFFNKKKNKTETLWRRKGDTNIPPEDQVNEPSPQRSDPFKKETEINKGELVDKTTKMIFEMAYKDQTQAENLLFELSEYNGQGFKTTKELQACSDKRLQVVYGKTKKMYAEWQTKNTLAQGEVECDVNPKP